MKAHRVGRPPKAPKDRLSRRIYLGMTPAEYRQLMERRRPNETATDIARRLLLDHLATRTEREQECMA